MSREHGSVRFGAQWRAALRLRLSSALLGADVLARLDDQAETIAAVQAQQNDVAEALQPARRAEALQPLLEWVRGAEAHLAALQAAQEHLGASALTRDGRAEDLQPLLEWVRGAESHLAALQAAHEHLRESERRQAAQLDRVTARAAALEARIADLERIDTEIVLAIARNRAAGPTR